MVHFRNKTQLKASFETFIFNPLFKYPNICLPIHLSYCPLLSDLSNAVSKALRSKSWLALDSCWSCPVTKRCLFSCMQRCELYGECFFFLFCKSSHLFGNPLSNIAQSTPFTARFIPLWASVTFTKASHFTCPTHTPYPDKAPRCGAFLSCFSSRNYGHFECCCHLSATFMQHKIRRALPSCSAVSNNSPSNKKSKATLNCVSFIDPRPPTIIGSSVLQRAAPNSSSWEFIFSSPSTHTGVARPGSICFIALRHTADPGPGVLFLN